MNWKAVLLGLLCLALAAEVRAESFSVSPNVIAFGYSDESFRLPKVSICAGDSAERIFSSFDCVENIDCLADFCQVPTNIVLAADECRQIRFDCELPAGENRVLAGRVMFSSDNNSFESVSVFVSKGISSPPVPLVGSVSTVGNLLGEPVFWGFAIFISAMFVVVLATRNIWAILIFGVSIFIFIFLFANF